MKEAVNNQTDLCHSCPSDTKAVDEVPLEQLGNTRATQDAAKGSSRGEGQTHLQGPIKVC